MSLLRSRDLALCALAILPLAVPAQQPLTLHAGELEATLPSSQGHLAAPVLRESTASQPIPLGEPFRLILADGRILTASTMTLQHPATLSPLPVDATAARQAAHLPGQQICADLLDPATSTTVQWCLLARGSASYLRQQITLHAGPAPLPLTQVELIQLHDPAAHVVGNVAGSPIVSGNLFLGFEHPLSVSAAANGTATAVINRVLPLPADQSLTYSSVVGLARPGQMRRDLLAYVELERAHPYRTFLHYNSWYDLGEGNRFSATDVLNRIHAFGTQLVHKRHVTMDSFLLDDGWDNTRSLWQFDSGFPNGFTPLMAPAKKFNFGIGVWLSPWGGYEREKQERIAFGHSQNYEIVNEGYALSGPRYYARFEEACLHFITAYGVNQFKFDGTGNANQVFPGSIFDSDFSAAIHLIERLRQAEPDLFINLTTGTKPSPFWLRYADSIWRSGEDHSFAGVGSWRQRWITYRDEQTYRNIVLRGPLFPLNSLMLHGIIYAQKAEHLGDDPHHDFPDEVHSYFGSGTDLQEMYITPSLLSRSDWDTLAEAARWSRENAATLVDTHWIGGDPGAGQIYGWASWGSATTSPTPAASPTAAAAAKGILVLRNPSAQPQTLTLNIAHAFELPPNSPQHFQAHSPWKADRHQPALDLTAATSHTFSLKPFEVLVLNATPTP